MLGIPMDYPHNNLSGLITRARNAFRIGDASSVVSLTYSRERKDVLTEIGKLISFFAHNPYFRGWIQSLKSQKMLPNDFPENRIITKDRPSFECQRLLLILYLQCPGYEYYLQMDHANHKFIAKYLETEKKAKKA